MISLQSAWQFYLNIGGWTELVEVTQSVSGQIGQDRSRPEDQQGHRAQPAVVHLEISHWQEIGNEPGNTKTNQVGNQINDFEAPQLL